MTEKEFHDAIANGDVELVKRIIEEDPGARHWAVRLAASYGQTEILEMSLAGHEGHASCGMMPACVHGRVDIMNMLREMGGEFDPETICGDAAFNGDVEVLRLVHSWGGQLTSDTWVGAVGHEDGKDPAPVLNYLAKNDCPWDEKLLEQAVREGRYLALLWLLDYYYIKGIPMNLEEMFEHNEQEIARCKDMGVPIGTQLACKGVIEMWAGWITVKNHKRV